MSLDKITELNAKMAAVKAEMDALAKQSGAEIVHELFAPLFALGIKSAQWQQYTPYFNDGDACEFHVYADELNLTWPNLASAEDGYENSASMILYYLEQFKPDARYGAGRKPEILAAGITAQFAHQVEDVSDEISKVLHANEALLRSAFGDHVRVTVTPGGVEVDDYEHD